jgi:hypothetical protein
MTHAACPDCLLRFSAAVAANQRACPFCRGPLVFDRSAAQVLGYQRYFEMRADPDPVGADDCRP